MSTATRTFPIVIVGGSAAPEQLIRDFCAAWSLPGVLPRLTAVSVASSTSSTTWKARPIAAA